MQQSIAAARDIAICGQRLKDRDLLGNLTHGNQISPQAAPG
jgi:hypothetical protein